MPDDAAHDPAGPQSDPVDAPTAMLLGTVTDPPAEVRSAVAVMEPAADGPTSGELPVWSFPDRDASTGAAPGRPAPVDRNQVELPFTPAESAATPAHLERPHPLLGPVARPRSAALVALLAVVTLGLSALVWHHRVNRELEEFDPKLHSRPMRSTVAVAVPWLVGMLVTIAGAVLIVGARLSIHVPFSTRLTTGQADWLLAGLVVVPYLTLILPFSVVGVVMTLERLRCVEEHVGTTTDRQVRPVAMSMLLALPVIGGLLLVGGVQRRVNAIWDAVAPAGPLFH